MIFIEELIQIIYSPMGKPFNTPKELLGSIDLGFILFPKYRLFILGVTTFLAIGIWLFLVKTKLGAIIRAGTDDSEMVDVLGIDISKIFTLVFGIGAGLAGLAGVLAAPLQNIFPYMGMGILTEAFVVVIIGGMGSIFGSILGGIIVGELITWVVHLLATFGQHIDLHFYGCGPSSKTSWPLRSSQIFRVADGKIKDSELYKK